MNFGPQTASNLTCICTHLRKFHILLYCQASQTEISERNSTKLCQTADGIALTICCRTVGEVRAGKNYGPKTFTLFGFSTTGVAYKGSPKLSQIL